MGWSKEGAKAFIFENILKKWRKDGTTAVVEERKCEKRERKKRS